MTLSYGHSFGSNYMFAGPQYDDIEINELLASLY